MHHAINKLPLITRIVDMHIKHKPDESKESRGIKTLDVIVKIGENNNIDKVFSPIKCKMHFIFSGI